MGGEVFTPRVGALLIKRTLALNGITSLERKQVSSFFINVGETPKEILVDQGSLFL